MKKWAHLLCTFLLFLSICAQSAQAAPLDEIISYESIAGKTEFIFYQHDGTSFTREGDTSHFDLTTGWLTGDTDGDGIDEIISYETIGSKTEFIFYQHDGTSFTREGDTSHFDLTTGWLTGDTDEALTLLSYSPTNATLKPGEGENLTFSMEAEQSDGASVSYRWELDGNATSTLKEWTYSPDYTSPGQHIVLGAATDGKLTVQMEWTVDVEEFNITPIEPEKPVEEQPETITDSSIPRIDFISPAPGEASGIQDVVWKVSDKLGTSIPMTLSVSGNAGRTFSTLTKGEGDGSFSWDTTKFIDGDYILKVTAANELGRSTETIDVTVNNREVGTLYISSNPTGAYIIIGGKDFGRTNGEVEIPAGYHEIEIKLAGFAPWAKWIEVKEGKNPDLQVRLIPTIFGLTPVQIGSLVLGGLLLVVIVVLLVRLKG